MTFRERLRNFPSNFRTYGLPLLAQGIVLSGLFYFADHVLNGKSVHPILERQAKEISRLDNYNMSPEMRYFIAGVMHQYALDQIALEGKSESPLETIATNQSQD